MGAPINGKKLRICRHPADIAVCFVSTAYHFRFTTFSALVLLVLLADIRSNSWSVNPASAVHLDECVRET